MKNSGKIGFHDWWSFGLGLGFIWPSGTMGSLLGVLIYVSLDIFMPQIQILIIGMIVVYSWYACCQTYKKLKCDHSAIVSDEVVGMLCSLLFIPVTTMNIVLGFVLFRFLDITKMWPIILFERAKWGAHAVMMDDVVAAIFTNLALHAGLYYLVN